MIEIHEAGALASRLEQSIARQDNAFCLRAGTARTLNTRCLIEIGGERLLLSIERGKVAECVRELPLLAQWDFAVRGSCAAWRALWQPTPAPGWHDLFALAKRGEMRLEGRLHPFMAHLQYFKDLLALPRAWPS